MDGRILVFILITFARGCEGVNGTCPADEFQCHNNKCITSLYLCDGDNDCGDRSDENLCDPCPANFFRCTAGNRPCVHDSLVCDGIKHCHDGSDESMCDTCKAGAFHCDKSRCILSSKLCDGSPDCGDNTDEANCDTCKAEAFHCDKSRCIRSYRLCDGSPDCDDNSDETNCDMATNKYGVLKIREPVFKNTDVELSFQLSAGFSPTQVGYISWRYTRSKVWNEIRISESKRVSLSELNATYSMLIKQAGDDDQGSYRVCLPAVSGCSRYVKLTLQGRPAKPILTIGVLKEGNSPNISCLSDNSRPPPKLYYKLGENTITVNQTDESYIGNGSSLSYRSVATLTSLERVWNNQMITCCLQHETLSYPLCSDRVKILYEFPPSAVHLSFTNVLTGTKQYITITCVVVNANPACGAIIKVNDTDISNVNVSHEADEIGGMTTVVMAQLTLKREDDGKRLFCTANCSMFATNQTDSFIFKFRDDSLATSRVQNVMIVAIVAAMVLLVATIAVMFVCIRKKRHRQEITQQEPSAEPAEPAEQAVLYEQLNREDMVHSSLYNELEIPIYANET